VRKHPIALIALLMLLILTSINIAKAFITPAPLPHVRLAMIDGTSLEGGFVAEAGSTWLIVQDNASIAAIEARQIRRSFITYPRSSPERSVLDWILGREPTKGFWGGPRKE
jgi:hypothetical protein